MTTLGKNNSAREESQTFDETRTMAEPLRICIVFDEDGSASSAEVLIKHVASDFECDTQSFCFDELEPPGPGVAAARRASDTDILVLAVRDDGMLPAHVQSWLGLCLGLRDEDQEGALVVLIAKADGIVDPNSSLLEYLETVAAIGGLAFFPRQRSVPPRLCLGLHATGATADDPGRISTPCPRSRFPACKHAAWRHRERSRCYEPSPRLTDSV
jgi:hypothetical protein